MRLSAFVILGLLAAAGPVAGSTPAAPPDSAATSASSYSVYLPSNYTPDRKWPILICFDPAKRAMVPIELFRETAEKYGFIIASSGAYESADSVGRSIDVMASLWNDVIARYPVDFDRVYATGLSGGGRICWVLDEMTKDVDLAGIIEVGAGLPRRDYLETWQPRLDYYGLVGDTDFNYYEMRWLDGELERRSIQHRLVTFGGGHEWPPAAACAEALDWMQVEAMRERKVAADSALVDRVYQRELEEIGEEEKAGRLIEARDRAAAAASEFQGLRDETAVVQIRDRLTASKEYGLLLGSRREIDRTASERLTEALDALDQVVSATHVFERPGYAQLVEQIGLPGLRMMRESSDREQSLAGSRILEAIYVRAAGTMPRALFRKGDFDGAAVLLHLAADIHPDRPAVWYDLGCAYARSHRPGDAIKALSRAVDAGFNDKEQIRSDPDLESIRSDSAFVRLLRRIG